MPAIVIVGGGVAGLGCAWQLRRAGHDVEVLEKSDVLGGRARSELPAGAYAVGFPKRARVELHALYQAHLRPGAAPDGAGLLVAQLADLAAERCSETPDAEVVEWVLERLASTPLGRLTPNRAEVTRATDALPRFQRGHLTRIKAFTERLESSPRLAFAGDYLVAPSVEGALASGLRAASQVIEGL